MYSSAVFESVDMTLEEASARKLERICRKLELNADDRLLEIGSGWGGFAIYAAKHYGCNVTTITISQEQFEEASGTRSGRIVRRSSSSFTKRLSRDSRIVCPKLFLSKGF
ncbi:MAG: hypothetical protein CM1200mP24_02040 [Gammaproteobacteria bacterium]|nr:MAG: hypothetical protein CM1200mP24_02040 [Gammaproteobacteria bacterium]